MTDPIKSGQSLIDAFTRRTGLTGDRGDPHERYLWTDALAVRTIFGISRLQRTEAYRELALKLVDAVHQELGRFRADDRRSGWISGLPDEEGRQHPTIGGLRIGKKLPERKPDERFVEAIEWERDGQYFHYLTRWVRALLQVADETDEKQYALWAAELVQASAKFVDTSSGRFRMAWKMSTDLTRSLVKSMGEHDPLDGLVCAVSVSLAVPEKAAGISPIAAALHAYCRGRHWVTTDSLGIGGLLLDFARTARFEENGAALPPSLQPAALLVDCVRSLELYSLMHQRDLSSEYRLAFRECGLALGLRVARHAPRHAGELDCFVHLADDIEEFWLQSRNQAASTWTEHLDINAVTLAASLVAKEDPSAFA